MSQTTGANIKDIYSFLNEGISSRTPLIRSGMYDAFNEFVDDYPELFDFGGGSTVVGPSAFEWDSIDIEELRDNYLAHVRETFTGKVTGNELRKIENAASSQFSDLMSQLDKKV